MFQRVTLIGNVGRDPQMRYTPSGIPVTDFSLATTTTLSKESRPECPAGWKESYNGRNWQLTTWRRVTCWRGLAETVNQYLSNGRQVYVYGEVNGEDVDGVRNPRVWTGNDGTPRASFEITALTVKFLGGRGDSSPGAPVGEPPPEGIEEDVLPF